MTVDAGGLLNVTNNLVSLVAPETITISGTGAGGHLELGNLFGVSNVAFAFDNTSPTAPNAGAIQFDNIPIFSPDSVFHAPITNVAWGNEFVVTGADFADDMVSYDGTTLTVVDAGVADPGSILGGTLFAIK